MTDVSGWCILNVAKDEVEQLVRGTDKTSVAASYTGGDETRVIRWNGIGFSKIYVYDDAGTPKLTHIDYKVFADLGLLTRVEKGTVTFAELLEILRGFGVYEGIAATDTQATGRTRLEVLRAAFAAETGTAAEIQEALKLLIAPDDPV